ncbi:MAG: hypothetical protein ACREJB_12130, partial [Planctomycetaceae bacterium]
PNRSSGMEVLHLVLYAAASLLALRSLSGLMAEHRQRSLRRRFAEQRERFRRKMSTPHRSDAA